MMMKTLLAAVLVAWTWTTPDGVQHWTDDAERVPARYAAEAQRVEIGPLDEYAKYSGPARGSRTADAEAR